jgi:hypothetical protein
MMSRKETTMQCCEYNRFSMIANMVGVINGFFAAKRMSQLADDSQSW